MSEMFTSNGKTAMEMSFNELKEEKKVQSWLARQYRRMGDLELFRYETKVKELEETDPFGKLKERYKAGELTEKEYKKQKHLVQRTYDALERTRMKVDLLRIMELSVRLFMLELEDAKRYRKVRVKKYKYIKTYSPYRKDVIFGNKYLHYVTKEELAVKVNKKVLKHYETLINRNGVVLQWDKRKLMMVARDRGYFSEIAVAYAIEQALEMPKQTIKKMLNEGKFTWGQVLVIGALFEMTPKEFCDTFLLGYFIEQGGEWRASNKNLDINGLLAKPSTSHRKSKAELEQGTTTEE